MSFTRSGICSCWKARRGEGLGLRWRDVNFDRGTAHIVQTVAPNKADKGKAMIQDRTKTARKRERSD